MDEIHALKVLVFLCKHNSIHACRLYLLIDTGYCWLSCCVEVQLNGVDFDLKPRDGFLSSLTGFCYFKPNFSPHIVGGFDFQNDRRSLCR
jgi:hypothetical protein